MLPWNRLAPLAPFAGLVAVYALYRQVYDWTQLGAFDPAVPAEAWRTSLDAAAAVADLGARLIWGLAALLLLVAFAATAWTCFAAIATATAGRLRAALTLAAGVAAAAGLYAGLAGNPLTLPRVEDELTTGFLRMGLADGPFLLGLFNGLGMGAAMLLTIAASTILTGADADAPALRRRARALQRVLFGGAAVLIAGSTTGAAMHRLPVAYLEAPWSQAFESLAQWTAVATGSLWTLFLIGIYLPAAAILRRRLAARAARVLPEAGEDERRAWIADHGFDLSPSQQLRRVVATLGPLLSSFPLAAFFELIG